MGADIRRRTGRPVTCGWVEIGSVWKKIWGSLSWGEGPLPWRWAWRGRNEDSVGLEAGMGGRADWTFWDILVAGKVEETLPIFSLSWEKRKNEHLLWLTNKI